MLRFADIHIEVFLILAFAKNFEKFQIVSTMTSLKPLIYFNILEAILNWDRKQAQ